MPVRLSVYAILVGAILGVMAGIATFGLPVPAGEEAASAPGQLAAWLLALGLGLAESALIGCGLFLLVVIAAAVVDLGRRLRQ